MSHNVTDALFTLMRLGHFPKWMRPATRLTLLCLADLANAEGYGARPSMTTLCRATGLDVRTVRRSLRRVLSAKDTFLTEFPATGRSRASYDFDGGRLQEWASAALERAKGERRRKVEERRARRAAQLRS